MFNLDEYLKQHDLVIVQFGLKTCNPCHVLKAKIEDYIKGNSQLEYIYIDLEEFKSMAFQMGIMQAPTIIVYFYGKEVMRRAGVFSLDEMLAKLEDYLALLD